MLVLYLGLPGPQARMDRYGWQTPRHQAKAHGVPAAITVEQARQLALTTTCIYCDQPAGALR